MAVRFCSSRIRTRRPRRSSTIPAPSNPGPPAGHFASTRSPGPGRLWPRPDRRGASCPAPAPAVGDDPRPVEPRPDSGTLRFDVLTGEWVAVATHRQTRTHLPAAAECPLCPSADGRPTEIPAADFDVVVFENRFPSLGPG